jgi:hypothetical protein
MKFSRGVNTCQVNNSTGTGRKRRYGSEAGREDVSGKDWWIRFSGKPHLCILQQINSNEGKADMLLTGDGACVMPPFSKHFLVRARMIINKVFVSSVWA